MFLPLTESTAEQFDRKYGVLGVVNFQAKRPRIAKGISRFDVPERINFLKKRCSGRVILTSKTAHTEAKFKDIPIPDITDTGPLKKYGSVHFKKIVWFDSF